MKQQHRARRLALQCICCLDVQGQKAAGMVELFLSDSREPDETIQTARRLTECAFGKLNELDAMLARHARHWELARLALVDRNILRLAAYEMSAEGVPHGVAITEALKLAKEFSTLESPRFVNGVLDSLAKQLEKDRKGTKE